VGGVGAEAGRGAGVCYGGRSGVRRQPRPALSVSLQQGSGLGKGGDFTGRRGWRRGAGAVRFSGRGAGSARPEQSGDAGGVTARYYDHENRPGLLDVGVWVECSARGKVHRSWDVGPGSWATAPNGQSGRARARGRGRRTTANAKRRPGPQCSMIPRTQRPARRRTAGRGRGRARPRPASRRGSAVQCGTGKATSAVNQAGQGRPVAAGDHHQAAGTAARKAGGRGRHLRGHSRACPKHDQQPACQRASSVQRHCASGSAGRRVGGYRQGAEAGKPTDPRPPIRRRPPGVESPGRLCSRTNVRRRTRRPTWCGPVHRQGRFADPAR